MADATVSVIERCWAWVMAAKALPPLNGVNSPSPALPLVEVALVAAVGRVHADHDVLLLDELPERVELRQGERARPPGSPAPARGARG